MNQKEAWKPMAPVNKKNPNEINHMYPKYKIELVKLVISNLLKKYMNEYRYR